MTPTPEHKLRTLIHAHRKAIDTILDDAQARVGNAILTANTEDDGATHEAIAAGVTLLNSARGRLIQIRAIKDTASTIGIKPATLNQP